MPKGKGARVKKVLPKGTTQEDVNSLNGMFDQLTGVQEADPDIIRPKYVLLRNQIARLHKVYDILVNFRGFTEAFPDYKSNLSETKQFFTALLEKHAIDPAVADIESKYVDMDKTEINALYKVLKESAHVKSIVVASGNLNHYKKSLSDEKNLKDDFIKKEPGVNFTPIPFCLIDLKHIWASDHCSSTVKKFLLTILHKTYVIGFSIYDNITSPNIDIKKFSAVLVESIKSIRKQVPRCDKAFDMISDSVSMLEGNFKGYYKTSVEAENPSLIIESFIVDVSMSQKTNASITGQFRRIIMYMKKKAQGNNDPRVKQLFKILNGQFSAMEKNTPGYKRDPEMDESLELDDEKKKATEKKAGGPGKARQGKAAAYAEQLASEQKASGPPSTPSGKSGEQPLTKAQKRRRRRKNKLNKKEDDMTNGGEQTNSVG